MYARYTEYLRDIMQNELTKEALENALSTYPLFASKNEAIADLIPTREQLNTKLLNHYKYREIGFETVGRFIDELEITMCEIMPRYNELYKTIEIMAEVPNPFDNVDIVETYEEERSSTSSSEGSTTSSQLANSSQNSTSSAENNQNSNSKLVESDTPQNSLSIGAKDIDSVDYASNVKWTGDEGTSSSEGSSEVESVSSADGSGTSNMSSESSDRVSHTHTKKGNQGVNTYAHDINEFRTSIIDVTEQIINDNRIAELFMLVY